jgi:PAS domain S-box-containing protein
MIFANDRELAQTLFEEAGDALFLFDPESEHIVDVNPLAQRLSGFLRLELIGMPITKLLRSEGQGNLHVLRQAFQRTGLFHSQEGFYLHRRQDNDWVPVNLTITRLHLRPKPLGLITARDISERKEWEDELRRSEGKYRAIFENAAEGIYQTTVDGRFLTANPKLAQIYGCTSPEELLSNLNNTENHFYADPGRRAQFILLMRDQGSVTNFESLIRRQDGKMRWISENAHTVRDADGQLVGYEGTVVDITERKDAEEAVARERYLLHSLMDNVPDGIYFKDHESRFLRVNLAMVEKFGLATPTDALAKSDRDFFAPEHCNAAWSDEQEVMRTGRPIIGKEEREIWQDGKITWVSTTKLPLQDGTGRIMGTFGISRDITESKRAEQALRDSEARYRSLIENMVQCVYLKSLDLHYVAVNKPFCRSLGLTAEDILGKSDFDLFPTDQAEANVAADRQVLMQGHSLEVEEEENLDGRRRVTRIFKTPVKDDRGLMVGVQGILWDVTERRTLEEQLRQSQKMEAVGQLAGGVAHDFNNLLTAILGNLALVQSRLPNSSQELSMLEVAEKAALRAAELTRQLLGFSRRTMLRTEPIGLNLAIEDTVRILQRTIDPRISVVIRTAPNLWTVRADPSQINQVLMNLCLNSRDAMPHGGQLILETENIVLTEQEARLRLSARAGEFVRLRVQDTGMGMTAETRAHIFEPFFTTKEPGKGTGLGLAMVFGIVQQHDGWIDCTSEIRCGARFDIYLPRYGQEMRETPTSCSAIPVHGQETILVVDDEVMIRDLVRDILQKFGYQVVLAEDGQQAVELYGRDSDSIDLVLLDLTMPRMSGRDALKRMILLNPEVRALLSSGYSADPSLLSEYPQVLGFVSKPYRPEDLARAVRAALDQSNTVIQSKKLTTV